MKFILNEKLNKQINKLSDKISEFIPFEAEFIIESNKLICNVKDGVDNIVDLTIFIFNDSSKISDIINQSIELIRYYYL